MDGQVSDFEALARLKAEEEERKSILQYSEFLSNFKKLVNENSNKVRDSICKPEANDKEEYVCIREPYEFINLFQCCTGQDECIRLFEQLLERRDKRVVAQIIKKKPDSRNIWFNNTKNGINLRPGLQDGEWSNPAAVTLGDDAVHALVGGRTGSGKSVFLNDIVFSLLTEYSPWELNIYMIDLKKVELSRYLSKYEVPHIKVVAATGEIRYVISVLTYLVDIMRSRQDFFALLGQEKLSGVRDRYSIVLPRIMLLVDEFQQLFLDVTSAEHNKIQNILTAITKLGRATGFHLLFASQEMSGTIGQSAFANFKARFALACDQDVSYAILGNRAASGIEKKGVVIVNTGDGSEEKNIMFKVPFIQENYFYSYLKNITDIAEEYQYQSVHKFYKEDSIKDIKELEEVVDAIKGVRRQCIENNSGIFDVITLGEAVVFNYKKYDYQIMCLEHGIRKNIGIFSPNVDDTAYMCKLLAINFKKTPNAKNYRNVILVLNDFFIKRYDLIEDLESQVQKVSYSADFLTDIVQMFNNRTEESALLDRFSDYQSLSDFAYEAFYLIVKMIYTDEDDIETASQEFRDIANRYFNGKSVKDIPDVKERFLQEYGMEGIIFFRVLDMLYQKEIEGKPRVELFEPVVIWIIGAEMVGKYPKGFEKVLIQASNYNMLFIFAAWNKDFDYFYEIKKSCDYLFVGGSNEAIYDALNIPYTKKANNSIVIDYKIPSINVCGAFKKFKYELNDISVPEIDFDNILSYREKL